MKHTFGTIFEQFIPLLHLLQIPQKSFDRPLICWKLMQVFLLFLPIIAADSITLQFLYLKDVKDTCADLKNITVEKKLITSSSCAQGKESMWIFLNEGNFDVNKTVTTEIIFNETITSTFNITGVVNTPVTQNATELGNNATLTYVQTHNSTDKVETVTVYKINNAAVVVAVIEGLIIGAIIIFLIYKSKKHISDMYPPQLPPEYPNAPGRNTVYYDNSGSLSYNDRPRGYYNENRQPMPTFATGRSALDNGPLPPIRMESIQPTQTRVQRDTPTLFPVPP